MLVQESMPKSFFWGQNTPGRGDGGSCPTLSYFKIKFFINQWQEVWGEKEFFLDLDIFALNKVISES